MYDEDDDIIIAAVALGSIVIGIICVLIWITVSAMNRNDTHKCPEPLLKNEVDCSKFSYGEIVKINIDDFYKFCNRGKIFYCLKGSQLINDADGCHGIKNEYIVERQCSDGKVVMMTTDGNNLIKLEGK